jgi:glycosyltransferase involved in cell wall biosynthesis
MVCATAAVAARAEAAGAEPTVIPLRRPGDVAGGVRVRRAVSGADVVHAHDRRSGLWLRLLPPPRPAARVYTVHGLPEPYLPPPVGPEVPGLRARVAYQGLDAWLCRRADAVVVPSHAVADLLVDRLGYPRAKLVVIPNGVEPGTPEPPSSRGQLVGSVSVLDPVKGLDVFLRAGARLVRERPEVRLALFGTGPDAARLERLAGELGIDGHLDAPGHVPAEEAFERLSVLVLSSWMENCPMSLLEAMAAGVPTVATAVGGVPEIVSDGAGLLVEPGDDAALASAIARVLDDGALARELAEAGRRRVLERFTAEANAAALLGLYERLLAERR